MEEGKVRRSDLGTPQGGVISPLLANIYLNYFDILWERHGSGIGELTRYADDLVVVCKTKKEADRVYKLIEAIMERLELTLHPTKTRIVGLWTGEDGFDFLGMHHRKTKAETSKGQVYYTTQQWLTREAEERIREVVKDRLAPPNMRHKSFLDHVKFESEDSGVAKLLLHSLQWAKASKVGLVHPTAIYKVVCQKATAQRLDEFVSRS